MGKQIFNFLTIIIKGEKEGLVKHMCSTIPVINELMGISN